MTTINDLEGAAISRTLAASDLQRLAGRWLTEAKRQEHAAEEKFEREDGNPEDREQRLLHLEIARVLRNCARDLGASA